LDQLPHKIFAIGEDQIIAKKDEDSEKVQPHENPPAEDNKINEVGKEENNNIPPPIPAENQELGLIHRDSRNLIIDEKDDADEQPKTPKKVLPVIDDMGEKYECDGPNTFMDSNHKCACLDGFPYGDPSSSNGCWKCISQCHVNAVCSYPGKCVCAYGYIGDGTMICMIPKPVVSKVSPSQILLNSSYVVTVSFSVSTNFTAVEGFCRFGKTIVPAEILGKDSAQCLAPKTSSPALRLSFSFDNISWSEEQIYIEYQNQEEKKSIVFVWQVWALAFAIISFVAIFSFCKAEAPIAEKSDKKDERQAFNPLSQRQKFEEVQAPFEDEN